MKKLFSRFTSLVLAAAVLCGVLPVHASAAEYKVVSENVLYYKDTHEVAEEYYMVSDQPVTTERYTVKGMHIKPTECLVNFVPSGALISDAPNGRGGYYSLNQIVDLDTGESLDANTMMQVFGHMSVYEFEQPVKIVGGYLYRFEYMTGFTGSAYVYVASKGQKPQVTTPTDAFNTGGKGICSGWAVDELNAANAYGLMPQFLTTMDVRKPATRAQFAEIAIRLYEETCGKPAPTPAANPFSDTSNPFALKAYALGVVTGTSANKYSPNSYITREQAATMLYRLYTVAIKEKQYEDKHLEPFLDGTSLISRYKDDALISPWAKDAVYLIHACNGTMVGVGSYDKDYRFDPKANISVEASQIAALRLYRYLDDVASYN